MILGILRVAGSSLEPRLRDGDFVVASGLPYVRRGPAAGDLVVLRHPVHGTLVKRVERTLEGGEELFVVGDDPRSVDSRRFGPVPRSWVLGKVILCVPSRR